MVDSFKETLISWIFAAESKGDKRKTKRIPGLMMELSFSRHIFRTCHSQLNLRNAAYGWFYIQPDHDTVRHWFKVYTCEPVFNLTEAALITELGKHGHRFFILQSNLADSNLTKEPAAPFICVDAYELQVEHNVTSSSGTTVKASEICETWKRIKASKTDKAGSYQSGITHRFQKKLNQVFFNHTAASEQALKSPFMALGERALEELLITRCIMNFGFTAPRDMDAIALDQDSRLVVIEFKRKYAASGRAVLKDQTNPDFRELIANAYKMQDLDFPEDGKLVLDCFRKYCADMVMKYQPEPCFGLDLSHFDTVQMCEDSDFRYLYLVWNSEDEYRFALSKVIPERLHACEVLLDHDFVPREYPPLLYSYIKSEDVSGVSFTHGEDSGAFNSRTRIQVTFDKTAFKSVGVHISQ